MGGMVAFRLAQKLEREGIYPQAVIISAIQPPHVERKKVSHLDDEKFLAHIIELGGMPQELVENKEVMSFFLPSFRSDYRALESFMPPILWPNSTNGRSGWRFNSCLYKLTSCSKSSTGDI